MPSGLLAGARRPRHHRRRRASWWRPGFIDMLGHSEYRCCCTAARRLEDHAGDHHRDHRRGDQRRARQREHAARAAGAPRARRLDGPGRLLPHARAPGPPSTSATFVTVGSVRRYVMGDEDRAPTAGGAGADAGARRGSDGAGRDGALLGLIYAPASYATTDEIVELARVAARTAAATRRTSAPRATGWSRRCGGDRDRRAGGHLGADPPPEGVRPRQLGEDARRRRAIEAARARGVDVTADQYPYRLGDQAAAIIPGWAHEGGTDSLLARLRDPETRRGSAPSWPPATRRLAASAPRPAGRRA
jgi:hypothetical protein